MCVSCGAWDCGALGVECVIFRKQQGAEWPGFDFLEVGGSVSGGAGVCVCVCVCLRWSAM